MTWLRLDVDKFGLELLDLQPGERIGIPTTKDEFRVFKVMRRAPLQSCVYVESTAVEKGDEIQMLDLMKVFSA